MEELYLGWVHQLEKGLEEWGRVRVEGDFSNIAVFGMGGSGIVGDYVAVLSNEHGGLPVIVSKSHRVPRFICKKTLAVMVSYSGNTLETLLALEKVLDRAGGLVVVSSDGRLEKIAEERGLPFVRVVKGIAPRTGLPHMLYGVLGVLDASGYTIVSREEAEKAYRFLGDVMSEAVDTGYRVASYLYEHKGLLVIATHTPYEALAIRGKNEFNENSKIPVKAEVAPEWMHNDIVGWEKPFEGNKYTVLAISDPSDKPGSRLVDFMTNVYERNNIPVFRLELRGSCLLEKLLYGSLVLGFASVKLARMRGLDPLKTTSIAEYKAGVQEIFRD